MTESTYTLVGVVHLSFSFSFSSFPSPPYDLGGANEEARFVSCPFFSFFCVVAAAAV